MGDPTCESRLGKTCLFLKFQVSGIFQAFFVYKVTKIAKNDYFTAKLEFLQYFELNPKIMMKKFYIALNPDGAELVDAKSFRLLQSKGIYKFYGENDEVVLTIPEKNVRLIKDITNDPSYFPRRKPGGY